MRKRFLVELECRNATVRNRKPVNPQTKAQFSPRSASAFPNAIDSHFSSVTIPEVFRAAMNFVPSSFVAHG
jgi:hypothetical protein